MHFPKYWARGEWTEMPPSQEGWRQVAWDCSDVSQEDAQVRAHAKAERLGMRIASAGPAGPDFYPYADRPVRETILRTLNEPGTEGGAVITRTAYGSEVLNTDGLMFIDIDLPAVKPQAGLLATLRRLLFGRSIEEEPSRDPVDARLSILRQWQAANPTWSFRVYRTHSGLRYLVSSDWQDPVADQTHGIFEILGCDVRYRQLCKIQQSFRARLTPKPWRCGLDSPPARFPYEGAEEEAKMEQWIGRYRAASENYATCQFLTAVGTSATPPIMGTLIAEHDTATKATSSLPLA